ncbi:MAG: hypothetical protein K1Y36_15695 [Blastocatellia bacterium]|nr:hypothetical protein [Blastocatellia bacterium]
MYSEIEDWKNGWFGVRLAASPKEIEYLIALLQGLLQDPDQHFHLTSDYKAASGLGTLKFP